MCNASFPASTSLGTVLPGDVMQEAVGTALVDAAPELTQAGNARWANIPMFSGVRSGSGEVWGHQILNSGGGGGAAQGCDGWPLITTSAAWGSLRDRLGGAHGAGLSAFDQGMGDRAGVHGPRRTDRRTRRALLAGAAARRGRHGLRFRRPAQSALRGRRRDAGRRWRNLRGGSAHRAPAIPSGRKCTTGFCPANAGSASRRAAGATATRSTGRSSRCAAMSATGSTARRGRGRSTASCWARGPTPRSVSRRARRPRGAIARRNRADGVPHTLPARPGASTWLRDNLRPGDDVERRPARDT